jgi:hypothetical protein
MYALRWMLCFQHGFGRDRFADATETMRQLMAEEHGRNFDCSEHVVCTDPPKLADEVTFPVAIDGSAVGADPMTDELVNLGLLHYTYQQNGTLLVRGNPLPQQPPQDVLAGMDMSISHSETVTEMLSQDMFALQKVQQEIVRDRTVRKDTYANKCMEIVKQTLKLTEDEPNKRRDYVVHLEAARDRYQMEVRPTSKRDMPSVTATAMNFAPSNDYKVGRVKRKGR